MATATTEKIGYKLVKNATDTAKKAPYTGMAIPVGSLATDNILTAMLGSGTRMSKATAKFMLDAFFEYCADAVASRIVRVSTGTVTILPAISGPFDSEDAAFDPLKNKLYVGAALSQELRDEVAGIEPTFAGATTGSGDVKITSVMDIETETFKVIRGTKNFRIAGIDLTIPDAEDESLALYDTSLLVKICDIIATETDGGQLITGHLPGTKEIEKGDYKIRLASHGLDPTAPLTITTASVTLAEAVVPTPELKTIQQGNKAAGVAGFGTTPITITGTIPGGKQTGDTLRLDCTDGGTVIATMDATSYITASDETELHLGNGINNDSAKPDSDWQNHQAKFVLTRASADYPLTFTFVNA